MALLVSLVFAIAAGVLVGAWIAKEKNRDFAEGALLGCFLGPIGWLIEALLPTKSQRDKPLPPSLKGMVRVCPQCGTQTGPLEKACPYCEAYLSKMHVVAKELANGVKICPRCGTEWPASATRCRKKVDKGILDPICGTDLSRLPISGIPEKTEPETMPRESDGRLTRACPACAEFILVEARLCSFCGTEVEPIG